MPQSSPRSGLVVALVTSLMLVASLGTFIRTVAAEELNTLDAVDILERASIRIAEIESLSFALDIEGETYVDAEETIQLLEASGELVRPNNVHARFKAKVLKTVTVSMEIITVDDKTWATDLITGNWDTAPEEFTYNPAILFDTNDGVGPVMDRVHDAERLEDEELRGHDVFHVRALVAGDVIGPLTSNTMEGSPITVDLWIDQTSSDLLRARLSETATEEDEPSVWTLDLDDHDKPFEIEPPDTES